jgi:predicted ATP-binding protein involved in virulence
MDEFRIKKLSLEGFRSFKKSELVFPDSNVLLLIGNNGKGKSSILDAIGILLNDFIEQNLFLRLENTMVIGKSDINTEAVEATITGEFEIDNNDFSIILSTNNEPSSLVVKDRVKANNRTNQILNAHRYLPTLIYYKSYRFFKSVEDFKESDVNAFTTFAHYDNAFSQHNLDFTDFQTWFRLEEDIENDQIRRLKDFKSTNPKLDVIHNCIKIFFENLEEDATNTFSELRVVRIGSQSKLVIKKETTEFALEQLSDGEKMLLLLMCDIARRLTQQNGVKTNPLFCAGIVLIDEIDMHLHPKWQRNVLPALTKTFPNIQFIATTHSPQVLSRVKREEVRLLDDGKILMVSSNPIGRDANAILEEIQQVSKRPKEIEMLIDSYFARINNNEFEAANAFKNQLLDYLDSEDPVFARANAMIERKKMLML